MVTEMGCKPSLKSQAAKPIHTLQIIGNMIQILGNSLHIVYTFKI